MYHRYFEIRYLHYRWCLKCQWNVIWTIYPRSICRVSSADGRHGSVSRLPCDRTPITLQYSSTTIDLIRDCPWLKREGPGSWTTLVQHAFAMPHLLVDIVRERERYHMANVSNSTCTHSILSFSPFNWESGWSVKFLFQIEIYSNMLSSGLCPIV